MQSTQPTPLKKLKLHFLLKKQLPYGTSIYVVGNIPILGTWHIKNSLRLNWNKDDYWSGFTEIQIFTHSVMYVYFKYVIANYQNPFDQDVIWEDGDFNRMIVIDGDDDNVVVGMIYGLFLENLWNMNRICINLLVPKYQVDEETEIYLAGGCNQLGNWRNKLKMQKTTLTTLSQKQLQIAKQNLILQDYHLYSVLLNIQRNLSSFTYYFLKKHHQTWLTDRIPTHELSISKCNSKHPTCLNISISTISSNYQLLQLSKFIQLYYSKILDNLYIGTSIETCDDVKELKKKCITDIVYVAGSDSSYCGRGPKNLVKMISQENKIEYWVVKVDVRRGEKVMDEVREGLELLNMLLDPEQQQQSQSQKQQPTHQQQKQQKQTDIQPPSPYPSCQTPTLPPPPPKILYVYCSSGTLLSPLLVSLYLHVYRNYSLKKSLQYVKEKHPIAAIDENIMSMALNFGRERFFGVERANFMRRGENVEREREQNRRKARQRREVENQRERESRRNQTMGVQNMRNEPIQLVGKMRIKDKE